MYQYPYGISTAPLTIPRIPTTHDEMLHRIQSQTDEWLEQTSQTDTQNIYRSIAREAQPPTHREPTNHSTYIKSGVLDPTRIIKPQTGPAMPDLSDLSNLYRTRFPLIEPTPPVHNDSKITIDPATATERGPITPPRTPRRIHKAPFIISNRMYSWPPQPMSSSYHAYPPIIYPRYASPTHYYALPPYYPMMML
jgi:hypothetical protein